ncbi:SRPBCC domain-containing protein [Paenibacillus silvisoli]|uniref:SRPBCC domain-containing protein n=1 Tax=Paenibacillus silvisoli TaxID=3110539 RepID=UPI002805E895|nr:SRPBCC domain-containing protein [Paenibacillus silvisoli]
METKQVGQTQTSGFQVGVRRTFPLAVEEAWALITSSVGTAIWLGEGASVTVEKGESFQSDEGISGEFTTVNPLVNIRLTWKRGNWDKPSILQIRTISNGEHETTISFHQEKLADPSIREEMKAHWEEVLQRLMAMN